VASFTFESFSLLLLSGNFCDVLRIPTTKCQVSYDDKQPQSEISETLGNGFHLIIPNYYRYRAVDAVLLNVESGKVDIYAVQSAIFAEPRSATNK
jgi:hypothetical protein